MNNAFYVQYTYVKHSKHKYCTALHFARCEAKNYLALDDNFVKDN